MALTKVQIISNAISILGHKPISTLDEGDSLIVAAEQAFNMLLPSVLCQSNWRFAVQIQQLSQTVETLPSAIRWQYVYLLPADFLKNIRLYPQTYEYEIYENRKIYTNFSGEAYMEYVFQPDISLLPPYFVNYFVFEVAAYLALSNAQKPEYFNVIDSKRRLLQGMAAAADAQNRPESSQVDFPVLSNRNIAGMTSNFS